MTDSDWIDGSPIRQLSEEAARAAERDYHITHAEALEIIEDVWRNDPAFAKAAMTYPSPDELRRTKAFKQVLKKSRRRIYYTLRQYHKDRERTLALAQTLERIDPLADRDAHHETIEAILRGHASTRERFGQTETMYGEILRVWEPPRTVLDVGCGAHPLAFPLDLAGKNLSLYCAAEKDDAALSVVGSYARSIRDPRLRAIKWDIRDGWEPLLNACGMDEFEWAIMLKLIPVVERRQPELLETLAEVPAKRWIVTGSTVSMTKQQSIVKRERATLLRFVETSGRRIVAEFRLSNEFGLCVE